MSKETSLVLLGLLVFLMPLSGFPSAWRTAFIMFAGLVIALIGFFMRSRALGSGDRAGANPFVESIHQYSHEEKKDNTD